MLSTWNFNQISNTIIYGQIFKFIEQCVLVLNIFNKTYITISHNYGPTVFKFYYAIENNTEILYTTKY